MAYHDPVTLVGHTVRLEPLRAEHAGPLFEALAGDEEVWRYLPTERPATVQQMQDRVDNAIRLQGQGLRLTFAVIQQESGLVIGNTAFLALDEGNRSLEIGWTWYGRSFWRSTVNSECKFLLLRHAFETLGCNRVQLMTDERNERSRQAIERIGGIFEGIIRNHRVVKQGHVRSSALYSLIANEWPERKAWFEETLAVKV